MGYLFAKVAHFYGFSVDEQLKMLARRWLLLVRWMPTLQDEERARRVEELEPLINAVLVAPQSKRRSGIRRINKLSRRLTRIRWPWKRKRKKWTGRLSPEASRRLDAQVAGLAARLGRLGLAGKIEIVKVDPESKPSNE